MISTKLISIGLVVLAVVGVLGGTAYVAHKAGAVEVQAEWDQAKIDQRSEMDQLQGKYDALQATNKKETDEHTAALRKLNEDHQVIISAIHADGSKRLLNSEARANVYQRQAESGAVECGNLASHAAELDRTLEQGRSLVSELRATLGQREDQLKLLGSQILSDRKLFSESDKSNGTATDGSPGG